MGRTVLILGVLLLLAGIVFALQGSNMIGGSSAMNGSSFWETAGIGIAILGIVLTIFGAVIGRGKRMAAATVQSK